MLDSLMRRVTGPPADRVAQLIVAGDIPAHALTMLGFCFALACFLALAVGFYGAALIFMLCNRLMDGLDGPVARASPQGATAFGGYVDCLGDFIFYGGFVFFFAVGQMHFALPAAFLLFAFIVSGVSVLATAPIQQEHKDNRPGEKSFHSAAAPPEGTETIIAFVLMCLLPQHFTIIAILSGLLCFAMAGSRLLRVRKMCRSPRYEPHVSKDENKKHS